MMSTALPLSSSAQESEPLSTRPACRRAYDDSRAFDPFVRRHIGPRPEEMREMLDACGMASLDDLIEKTVPNAIRLRRPLQLEPALSEAEALERLRRISRANECRRCFIGMGFYGTITPPVIQRNILENPGWYTQYTPYQAEISQGRQEALLNFQTMVADLTGMEIANASLLDEGSAAAESMTFCFRLKGHESKSRFFVSTGCHPHVLDVVLTRARPLGIEVVSGDHRTAMLDDSFFGAIVQYPMSDGEVVQYGPFADRVHALDALLVADADLLSLALLVPPGEWGADVAVGSTQRFGVPLGFGGPHAAYFATKSAFQRNIPGRIVGVSKDAEGNPALRLSLQTREQHIRREKATSNICTAQVLLAVMAGMYAVYHGPRGIKRIAERVHGYAHLLAKRLGESGVRVVHEQFFDTLRVEAPKGRLASILERAEDHGLLFRLYDDSSLGISVDETTHLADIADIIECFLGEKKDQLFSLEQPQAALESRIDAGLRRRSAFLTHPVFSRYHSETELLRYIFRLQSKDLSLAQAMIPLGSCTMKLNAAAEMMPVSWPEFSSLHPFAPLRLSAGYQQLFSELSEALCELTGHAAISLQPNAGSQGEYAGLLAIGAYHAARGNSQRRICLIPASAHGTNPASAVLAGMEVMPVRCDEAGNVDIGDLKHKAEQCDDRLAALMITYPSTHGVFEESIKEMCEIVHSFGGQVYMDGANLNAQVGLCRPGDIGADVCHLNLHKTFAIPHGGGGPGVGPITVHEHLARFLPGHVHLGQRSKDGEGAVASAPWGSASVLPISWMYIKMMGGEGLTEATKVAILNANYLAARLEPYFCVLYRGKNKMVAHECILDLRHLKRTVGIEAGDIAKRLMDYGFHAPTVSFPVPETLMVEPTESESKVELDRFCDAMIRIRQEIDEIQGGKADRVDNALKNAPHTAAMLAVENWTHPYSRAKAAYPAPWLYEHKFWPAVGRIDNVYGDRNLFCSCMPAADKSE